MATPVPAGPQPGTGLPPGVQAGPLGPRFAAYLIDSIVPGILGVLLALVVPNVTSSVRPVLAIVFVVVIIGWIVFVLHGIATRAASPGMRLMKLQLVGFYDGRPVGWGRALLRYLVLGLVGGTVIGFVILLVLLILHPRKQGWHDLAVKAVVIKERPLAPRPSAQPQVTAQPAGPGYEHGYPESQYSGPQNAGGHHPDAQSAAGPYADAQYGDPQYPNPQYVDPQHGATPQYQPQPAQSQPDYAGQGYSAVPSPPPAPQPPAPPVAPPPGYDLPSAPLPGITAAAAAQAPYASQVAGPPTPAAPSSADPYGFDDETRAMPVPAPTPTWVAALDDGRQITVDGLVLLGRNPQPQPGEEDAQLIKLADETRTVSKSHLAIGLDAAGLFVVDRGSTNGSTVTTPDGVSSRCQPGDIIYVDPGSIVSIGDHWLEIRRDG